jgi:hypothetical protein
MNEPCGDDDVRRLPEGRRPLRAHRERDAAHQRRDEDEPVEKELERRRVREAVLRGDEAGAPQQHEQEWKRELPTRMRSGWVCPHACGCRRCAAPRGTLQLRGLGTARRRSWHRAQILGLEFAAS